LKRSAESSGLIRLEHAASMIISVDDPVTKGAQRFEVFTGAGKRREWPPEVKASIVAECYSGRDGVSAVARRHGLDPSQVYAWRRDLRKQLDAKGAILPSAVLEAAAFVPAVIEPSMEADPSPKRRPRRPRRRRRLADAAVELEIDGVAVKIGRSADVGVIAAVIEALKAQR
jgi:transposase